MDFLVDKGLVSFWKFLIDKKKMEKSWTLLSNLIGTPVKNGFFFSITFKNCEGYIQNGNEQKENVNVSFFFLISGFVFKKTLRRKGNQSDWNRMKKKLRKGLIINEKEEIFRKEGKENSKWIMSISHILSPPPLHY